MIKILHVVTWMGRGGLEVWLMEVARKLDNERFSFDIVVQTDQPGVFDKELEALGVRVIFCRGRGNPVRFAASFSKIIKDHGPYDVVHSHLHHFSAIPLTIAKLHGVKTRIAHSHNIVYDDLSRLSLSTRAYLSTCKTLLDWVADYGLACSRGAATDLFGPGWEKDDSRFVLHCGVKLAKPDESSSKRLPSIPADKKVIGHVGRFVPQKNHELIFSICKELNELRDDFCLVLAGDGKDRKKFEDCVTKTDALTGKVVFLGEIDNVNDFLSSLDVFLFPSLHEGLGLALVEAQAAGLPCLISDVIPAESHVVPELVSKCSLSSEVSEWVKKLERILDQNQSNRIAAFKKVKNSTFNIDNSVAALQDLYSRAAYSHE